MNTKNLDLVLADLISTAFVVSTADIYVNNFVSSVALEDFICGAMSAVKKDLRQAIELRLMQEKKMKPNGILPFSPRKLVLVKK